MIMRFRSFGVGLILFVIGLWSRLFGFAAFCRDFVVDRVASAFKPSGNRQPVIRLSRSQVSMREYFNKLKGFGGAVWLMNGFTHKLAVNANARMV